MPAWDETYRRLLWWTQGRAPSERMAAHIIADAGYKDVIPTHPLGGPDSGADATCTKDGKPCVMAAYFPVGPKRFPTVKNKLEGDLNAAQEGGREFTRMAFVTNQELTLGQRKTLEALGRDVEIDLFHLERCMHILDLPHMAETKKLYLDIPAGKPEEPLADLVYPMEGSDLPAVEVLDPYRLGATASVVGNADSYGHADPYVARTANDVDERLDAALTNPPSRSRMVLLVGPSKAGKTRTAFEALRRVLPTARLAAPLPGMLTRLAAHSRWQTTEDTRVVWLDDLYRFLAPPDPLTPALLDKLTARSARSGPVVVVATLRSRQRNMLRQQGQAGNGTHQIGEMSRDTQMLLDHAHEISLRATNEDETEKAAARDAYPELGLDGGLAAELAGAPELLRQYDDAADSDPVMHAVVQVVIDWDRVGRTDPVREPALRSLARQTLWAQRPELEADDAQLTDAIQIASTPPDGAGLVAMLDTTRDDDGLRQYRPFDYLVAADDGQNHPTRDIPDNMWNHALADADPDQLMAVGFAAASRTNHQTALTAFTQAGEADYVDRDTFAFNAMFVGTMHLLLDRQHPEIACAWFERAADAGRVDAMKNLANIYGAWMDPPDLDASRHWLKRAVDAGSTEAMIRFGADAQRMDPPDLDEARRWYERAAAAGDSDAMVRLGALFGEVLDPVDLDEAGRWFKRAADAGNNDAMYNLGVLYKTRMDPPDLDEARRWFERAADAGNGTAMFELGKQAQLKDPPDLEVARAWFERAADAGDTDLLYKIGYVYMGETGPPDLDEARRWFERAADAGESLGMFALGYIYADRMDPPDLDEARRWFERAADAGSTEAMMSLGILYENVLDPPDLDAAGRWYERAADAGSSQAASTLESFYTERMDPPDLDAARGLWERAADAGDSHAMLRLGVLYADVLDPPDLNAARRWWERAADAGNSEAMSRLGFCYAVRMDPPDLDEGRRWLERAADAGDRLGMFALGLFYADVLDPPDLDEARRWYERAADAGNSEAMFRLGVFYAERMDPPDLDSARSWWRRAAALGHEEATGNLQE